jgi:flagella basal body P-ring formation protein FlgA
LARATSVTGLIAVLLAGSVGDAMASVGPAVVEQAVRARAAADLGVPVSDVEIAFLGLGRALDCPETATVRVVSVQGESWRGVADVTVAGVDGRGVTCDRLRLRPRVEAWIATPVAAVPIAVGEPLQLIEGRVRVADLRTAPVAMGVGRWQARVPLAAGEPVTLAKVEPQVDARTGDNVTVVVSIGSLIVKAEGRLLEDATVGAQVRVTNLATGAMLTGALIEPGLVRAGGTR